MKSRGQRPGKLITFGWIAALVITIILLIYWEQTAILYILATVGVTALLIVVALSDLASSESPQKPDPQINDSAAIGSGISSAPKRRNVRR